MGTFNFARSCLVVLFAREFQYPKSPISTAAAVSTQSISSDPCAASDDASFIRGSNSLYDVKNLLTITSAPCKNSSPQTGNTASVTLTIPFRLRECPECHSQKPCPDSNTNLSPKTAPPTLYSNSISSFSFITQPSGPVFRTVFQSSSISSISYSISRLPESKRLSIPDIPTKRASRRGVHIYLIADRFRLLLNSLSLANALSSSNISAALASKPCLPNSTPNRLSLSPLST